MNEGSERGAGCLILLFYDVHSSSVPACSLLRLMMRAGLHPRRPPKRGKRKSKNERKRAHVFNFLKPENLITFFLKERRRRSEGNPHGGSDVIEVRENPMPRWI